VSRGLSVKRLKKCSASYRHRRSCYLLESRANSDSLPYLEYRPAGVSVMTLTGNYQRTPRKSIWLSQDTYSTLNVLKNQYETVAGNTDWGKFLLLLAGIAIGTAFLSSITQQNSQNEQAPA
jgi:hypothetical protein